MVLLFEVLSATFPHQFNIVLGACFVIIVFFLPAGVVGGIESLVARLPRMARGGRAVMSENRGGEPLLAISGLHKAFGGLIAVNRACVRRSTRARSWD